MIGTNALLAATFAVISQFHTVVTVPPRQVPRGLADVDRFVVGSPFSPLEVFVQLRNRACYTILDGSVRRYETVNSYAHLQDPEIISNFMGPAKLNSNQVFNLAATTIGRLTKEGSLKPSAPPRFTGAGQFRGETIPFYYVNWFLTNTAHGPGAAVEVDARTGEITFLDLRDRCFRDYALAQQISNRVYAADPPHPLPPRRKKPRPLPHPPTNDVSQAITALVAVCGKLGVSVADQTNAAGVDWERSYSLTNTHLSATTPVYQIAFTNGAQVTAFGGAVIAYQLPDAFGNLDTPPRDSSQFFGTVNKRWRDLARDLEDVLKTNFGFSPDLFAHFMAVTAWGYADAAIGTKTVTPVMVMWLPYFDPSIPGYEAKIAAMPVGERGPGFSVEFDLQSGQIKAFGFFHPKLVEMFARAQRGEH